MNDDEFNPFGYASLSEPESESDGELLSESDPEIIDDRTSAQLEESKSHHDIDPESASESVVSPDSRKRQKRKNEPNDHDDKQKTSAATSYHLSYSQLLNSNVDLFSVLKEKSKQQFAHSRITLRKFSQNSRKRQREPVLIRSNNRVNVTSRCVRGTRSCRSVHNVAFCDDGDLEKFYEVMKQLFVIHEKCLFSMREKHAMASTTVFEFGAESDHLEETEHERKTFSSHVVAIELFKSYDGAFSRDKSVRARSVGWCSAIVEKALSEDLRLTRARFFKCCNYCFCKRYDAKSAKYMGIEGHRNDNQ